MSDPTRFIWIRHFPVAESGVFVGQSQAGAVVPPLVAAHTLALDENVKNALRFTSPLRRAVQTMQWIHQSLNVDSEAIHVPELMEQSFGAWEGKPYRDIEIDHTHPEALTPPQGESFLYVTQRVHGWIDGVLNQFKGRTLVIVCHAGVIRAALGHALAADAAMTLRFQPAPATLTETQYLWHDGMFYGQVAKVSVPLITHVE